MLGTLRPPAAAALTSVTARIWPALLLAALAAGWAVALLNRPAILSWAAHYAEAAPATIISAKPTTPMTSSTVVMKPMM